MSTGTIGSFSTYRSNGRRDRAKIVLIGQVMELDTDEPHIAGMSLRLCRQEKVIAKMTTNPYGEFRVEFDDMSDDLSLVVDLNHTEMVIALSDPASGAIMRHAARLVLSSVLLATLLVPSAEAAGTRVIVRVTAVFL